MFQSLDINAPKTNVSCLLGLGNKPFVVGALYLNNMETEVWKDVVGYEGLYQVSSYGRVKSLGRFITWRNKNGSRWINTSIRALGEIQTGRLNISLCKNGSTKTYIAHRLVALHFIPNPNNLPEVNHKDENPKNNNVDNLEWATRQYNLTYGTVIERRVKTRLKNNKWHLHGEMMGGSKLKKKEVIEIYYSPLASRKLAKIHNVNKTQILRIKNKTIWKYLTKDL